MKNLLTVLKKLGKKMTSQDINGTNLVTVVDDIANKYTGGSGGGGGCDCTLIGEIITDGTTQTLNKTWQEIHDALAAGKRVVFNASDDAFDVRQFEIQECLYSQNAYKVLSLDTTFVCATPSDYPSNGEETLQ